MSPPGPLAWPEPERPHLAGAASWLTASLATRRPVTGPAAVLWVKSWGVTALFRADDELVVFKDAWPPVFGQAAGLNRLLNRVAPRAAPTLLAHEDFPGYSWSAFEYVAGPTVSEDRSPAAMIAMAEQLARVQSAVLADTVLSDTVLADTVLAGLPGYDVAVLPDELAGDLADQPAEVRRDFDRLLPSLRRWATQLATAVPRSLDHPDMNLTNGIVADDRLVLLDWEEAVIGCPLFSLDRLTGDDMVRADAAIAERVTSAYLDALGWGSPAELRAAYQLASPLVPLRRAVEARAFARALRRPDPHTRFTGRLLAEANQRAISKLRVGHG